MDVYYNYLKKICNCMSNWLGCLFRDGPDIDGMLKYTQTKIKSFKSDIT